MKKNKKIIVSIISVIVLLGIVGFSYAYFVVKINGNNEAPIESVKTASLGIKYEDNGEINLENIKPGDKITKTFSVSNTSNTTIRYNIEWSEVINTYVEASEVVYKIESNDGGINTNEEIIPTSDEIIRGYIEIKAGESHNYTITIEYKNLENNNILNMGKEFRGKIQITTEDYGKEYGYTGAQQEYTVPNDGYYEIELWGGGLKGAYTKGTIQLNKGEKLYFYVGQNSQDGTRGSTTYGRGGKSFNGGGTGGDASTTYTPYSALLGGPSGGGASDVRLISGAWNDSASLRSRIMVAGGSGGGIGVASNTLGLGYGGNLLGEAGVYPNDPDYRISPINARGLGGTQISGGLKGNDQTQPHSNTNTNGVFGKGGTGANSIASISCHGVSGGGGGYYGGGGGDNTWMMCYFNGGGGGSSYISGYAGVNSVLESGGTAEAPIHSNNTIHYSNKYFINGKMQAGINSGNGKAKITYIETIPSKTNTKLNNVRYIKSCLNGNNGTTSGFGATNQWSEIQAIKDGINLAKGKSVTGTVNQNASYPYTLIVDGIMTNSSAAGTTGVLSCVTIDLGAVYNLDEIVLWGFWQDSRKAYQNTLSVGATNAAGTTSLSTILHTYTGTNGYQETSQGKRYTAWD